MIEAWWKNNVAPFYELVCEEANTEKVTLIYIKTTHISQ
jgi:hypothetical protein